MTAWRTRLAEMRAQSAPSAEIYANANADRANSAAITASPEVIGTIGANGTGMKLGKFAAFPVRAAEDAALAGHHAAPTASDANRAGDPDPSGRTEDFSQVDSWIRGAEAQAGPDLPQPDLLLRGLLIAARSRPPARVDPAAVPSIGAFCSVCDGRRWWMAPPNLRCWTCRLLPPGRVFKEKRS